MGYKQIKAMRLRRRRSWRKHPPEGMSNVLAHLLAENLIRGQQGWNVRVPVAEQELNLGHGSAFASQTPCIRVQFAQLNGGAFFCAAQPFWKERGKDKE